MIGTDVELDRLYALLNELSDRARGPRRLIDCDGRMGWPQRGVYFFFEPGETRRDGSPRVVRVGTHALKPGSDTTLWGRLSQHRGTGSGGGNHRSSIFRRHVGTALLLGDKDLATDPSHATWGRKSADAAIRALELDHERRVSHLIRHMPFLWLPVDDPAGPTSDRGHIEAGTIAILSRLSNAAADSPSPGWLGKHSNREAIVGSGLWNINHVRNPRNPDTLTILEHWVHRF